MYTVTPVLNTGLYASGDVLFDNSTVAITGLASGREYLLRSFSVIDAADLGIDMTLFFMNESFSLGTVNDPPTIGDINAAKIIGSVNLVASGATWFDLGGAKMITITRCELILPSPIFIAAVILGAPTYAVNSLTFNFGLVPAIR